MKNFVALVCTELLLVITGCGGGGGGGAQPLAAQERPPPENPPPASPPPYLYIDPAEAAIECANIIGPAQGSAISNNLVERSEVAVSPGRIYSGIFYDCTNWGAIHVDATVSEHGVFHIHSYLNSVQLLNLLSGSLQTDGDSFQGSGRWFSLYDGVSAGLWLDGVVDERKNLAGHWGNEWGHFGLFKLAYDSYDNKWPPGASPIEIKREMSGMYWGSDVQMTWTVETDGQFNGGDTTGCEYAGQFAPGDPRYNLVEVEFTVTGCAVAGRYSGFGRWHWGDDSGGPPALYFKVDDGEEGILTFLLSGV